MFVVYVGAVRVTTTCLPRACWFPTAARPRTGNKIMADDTKDHKRNHGSHSEPLSMLESFVSMFESIDVERRGFILKDELLKVRARVWRGFRADLLSLGPQPCGS